MGHTAASAQRVVVVAHGLEGRPDGRKPTALRAAGLEVICPDMRGMVLAPRVELLVATVKQHPGCVLVGSSYGGLASMAALPALADLVHHLVLLAPALHHREPPLTASSELVVPARLPADVVHGCADEVVPLSVSEELVARSPHVALRVTADGHLLIDALPGIVERVRQISVS